MIKYEEKFIVINTKRFDEMRRAVKDGHKYDKKNCELSIKFFCNAVQALNRDYNIFTGGKMEQQYYACNKDEPYAQKVIDIILEGEREKETP